MPMPRRSSVDDFFAQLSDGQRPHLQALRRLSLDADPDAQEELKWNLPVYVRGENTSLWMLQNFKNHCSLRFPPPFFATQRAAVRAAGFEAGEGFIKLPYDRELPLELLKALMRARVEEYAATGAGWNDR
ncbi:MAG: iron chaperone [Solirubrobacteraceae bacterium]